jgi:hypothetical protein
MATNGEETIPVWFEFSGYGSRSQGVGEFFQVVRERAVPVL